MFWEGGWSEMRVERRWIGKERVEEMDRVRGGLRGWIGSGES